MILTLNYKSILFCFLIDKRNKLLGFHENVSILPTLNLSYTRQTLQYVHLKNGISVAKYV